MRSSDLSTKVCRKIGVEGGKGLFSQRESRRFIALPSSSSLKYSHPCLPCISRSHLRFVCLNVLFSLPFQMMSWGRQRKSRCKRGTRLHRMFLFFARDKTENRTKERRGNLLLLTTHFSPFPSFFFSTTDKEASSSRNFLLKIFTVVFSLYTFGKTEGVKRGVASSSVGVWPHCLLLFLHTHVLEHHCSSSSGSKTRTEHNQVQADDDTRAKHLHAPECGGGQNKRSVADRGRREDRVRLDS